MFKILINNNEKVITLLKQSRNDMRIVMIAITVITSVTVMAVILNTKTEPF